MTRFIAFWHGLKLPGTYNKYPLPKADVDAFTRNGGDGFWSMVTGKHAILIVITAVDTTVSDCQSPSNDERPEVAVGDEVLVVIPEEGVTLWADSSVDDLEDADRTGSGGPSLRLPFPACRFEKWERLS